MSTCYTIGNPLVDYITDVDDAFLTAQGLTKGRFHGGTREQARAVLEAVRGRKSRIVPGGAAANTACGVGRMGGTACFTGGVGRDDAGAVFRRSLDDAGVEAGLVEYPEPTGFVAALVTPDAERTFLVYLGASLLLTPDAIDRARLKEANFFYCTGYMFEDPGLRKVITAAAAACRSTMTRVAMDLADPGIVARTRADLKAFIAEHVDILFANETEGRALTDREGDACLAEMARGVDMAVLKLGAEGALISATGRVTKVPPCPVERVVDTTGAGDMFAAGILCGLDRGCSLEYTGRMAAYAAAQVIRQKGARLDRNIAAEVGNL